MPDGFLPPILEVMGDTPDAVASTLRQAGVRGVRHTVRFLNPVVRFVQARLRVDAVSLDVIKGAIMRLRFFAGTKEEATLPVPVKAFLDAFNDGAYPDLEAKEVPA